MHTTKQAKPNQKMFSASPLRNSNDHNFIRVFFSSSRNLILISLLNEYITDPDKNSLIHCSQKISNFSQIFSIQKILNFNKFDEKILNDEKKIQKDKKYNNFY